MKHSCNTFWYKVIRPCFYIFAKLMFETGPYHQYNRMKIMSYIDWDNNVPQIRFQSHRIPKYFYHVWTHAVDWIDHPSKIFLQNACHWYCRVFDSFHWKHKTFSIVINSYFKAPNLELSIQSSHQKHILIWLLKIR